MKLLKLIKSNKPQPQPQRVKLRASTSRTISRRDELDELDETEPDDDDYDTPEPTMKLSHAFVVVLLLHIIAVAGVFGFNQMKSRQQALENAYQQKMPPADESTLPPSQQKINPAATSSRPSEPTPQALPKPTIPSSHTVVAGDTLTRIAAKYGVTVASLQQLNNLGPNSILRVGQVLRLPTTDTTSPPDDSLPDLSNPLDTYNSRLEQVPGTVTPKNLSRPNASNPATFQTIERKPSATPQPPPSAIPPTSTATASSTTPTSPPAPPPQPVRTADGTTRTHPPAATTSQPPSNPKSADDSLQTYEVVAGDNPYKIAKKFGVSYQDLLKINNIDDPRKLRIGQKLKIPPKKSQ